jgi:hypothetical protein
MLQKTATMASVIAAFTAFLSTSLFSQISLFSSNGFGSTPVMSAYVDPVPAIPSAPFSATVTTRFKSRWIGDRTKFHVDETSFTIARDAKGRTYDDIKWSAGNWQVTSGHIYDPATRLNTTLIAEQHIARLWKSMGEQPEYETNPQSAKTPLTAEPPFWIYGEPVWHKEDLGIQMMEGVMVHGVRLVRNIPASASGTGQPVETTDEFWYSAELHMNVLITHTDPRDGEQTFKLTRVTRGEPDPQLFQVPEDFTIVELKNHSEIVGKN